MDWGGGLQIREVNAFGMGLEVVIRTTCIKWESEGHSGLSNES